MKLRNKRTGEIVMVCKINPEPYEARDFECSSLAELNEEWEDYKEPKGYWYIDGWGDVSCDNDYDTEIDNQRKAIGNYFETKEEAEKAVERLKAWKRLKEKGFRFTGHFLGTEGLNIRYECNMKNDISDDLDLLFGGEK